jgi:NAD(P)-dependent dehydrogenase (short-subunit alcohol dehydrogenase family)
MIGFARSVAREIARLGVNVNALAPAAKMTEGLGQEQPK